MSVSESFNRLGINAIKGSEMMSMLNISPEELSIPQRFQQFKEVFDYLQDFENYRYVINKITRGKDVDRLEHTHSYITLAKEREFLSRQKEAMEEQITKSEALGATDFELISRHTETLKDLETVTAEMEFHEK